MGDEQRCAHKTRHECVFCFFVPSFPFHLPYFVFLLPFHAFRFPSHVFLGLLLRWSWRAIPDIAILPAKKAKTIHSLTLNDSRNSAGNAATVEIPDTINRHNIREAQV